MITTRALTRGAAAGLLAVLAAAVVSPLGAEASAGQVRSCASSDLTASYRATDAGAGHRYGKLVLTNTADSRCRTGGYGGLSYVGDGDGTQIGAAATRASGTVKSYVVRPGQRLVSDVDAAVAGNYSVKRCRPAHVDGFRVYVPNATQAQYVVHATRGCRNPKVHLLSHGPLHRP
jgi:hypothetical protein